LFNNVGSFEIIIIAIVLLILFGGKKLPELSRGLAESIKEFRDAFKDKEKNKK
jgi:sec-independent protein translocase protein TatA